MAALTFNWLDRLGARRRSAGATPVPLMPSRDLPPIDAMAEPSLPRSPEPIPDEALVFAQGAPRRLHLVEKQDEEIAMAPAASIATGADLRAMLERFERAHQRRQALSQAAQARSRLVERLAAGKAAADEPALKLVATDGSLSPAASAADDERRIEQAMEEALASALGTLKRLSMLARD